MFNGTKDSAAKTRIEINKALAMLTEATGMDFSIGLVRFDANTIVTKLTGVRRGATGKTDCAVDMKEVQLVKVGKRLLGPDFDINNTYLSTSLGRVTFVGYNARAHAYPYIVKCESNGKRFKITSDAAKRMLRV